MRVLGLFVVLGLLGCPSSNPPPITPIDPPAERASEGGEGCPAAGAGGTACTFGVTETRACASGRVTCRCGEVPQCGGAQRPAPQVGEPGVFSCTSSDATLADARGCPYVQPQDGAACAVDGTSCPYAPCSWHRVDAQCAEGAWKIVTVMGPPPP